MKKIFKKLFKGKSGFSLLEVILAFALMVVSANVFLPAQAQAMTYVYKASELRKMSAVAGKTMATGDNSRLDTANEKTYIITTKVYNYEMDEILQQSSMEKDFVGVIENTDGTDYDMQQIQVYYTDWRELPVYNEDQSKKTVIKKEQKRHKSYRSFGFFDPNRSFSNRINLYAFSYHTWIRQGGRQFDTRVYWHFAYGGRCFSCNGLQRYFRFN